MPPTHVLTGTASALLEPISTVPTAGPDIDLRQVTQSNFYVTLSITRDSITYTTTILLAGTETPTISTSPNVFNVNSATTTTAVTAVATPATTTTTAIASPFTTTAAIASPSTTTSPDPVVHSSTPIPGAISTDPSSGSIVGAIVGSVVGSLVFILLLWTCCYLPFFFRARETIVRNSSRSSSSGSTTKRPPGTAERIRISETTRTRVRVR